MESKEWLLDNRNICGSDAPSITTKYCLFELPFGKTPSPSSEACLTHALIHLRQHSKFQSDPSMESNPAFVEKLIDEGLVIFKCSMSSILLVQV